MCVSKPQSTNNDSQMEYTNVKTEPTALVYQSPSTVCSDDSEVIEFGPIKVKPRKRPAPTLATGRRSKYEILTPAEEQKRNIRRARNRAAAERVRVNRLGVEQSLIDQINLLENEERQLTAEIGQLENQRIRLAAQIYTHQQICSNAMPLQHMICDNGEQMFFDEPMIRNLVNDKTSQLESEDFFTNILNTNFDEDQQFPPENQTLFDIEDLL